jgi:hypothetical protein
MKGVLVMNLNTNLKKAWQMLWSYRSLWLFGAVLALVGANIIYPFTWRDWANNDQWTRIKLSDSTTIQVPGVDMTIDLTAPGGFRIITPDVTTWSEFNDLVDQLDLDASINLWPILIEVALILVVLLLFGMLARYVTETAMIRMVNETEEAGERLSFWEGLQRGFSFRAGRLFLLDLAIGILTTVAFIVFFGLATTPILLAIRSHEIILVTAGVGTFGLLVLAFYLWLAVSAVLSLVLQTIRRACVLEQQSLLVSIRQGVTLTKHHLKEIGPLWLVWMGLRLLWIPLAVPILILFVPFLLLTIPLGTALGGMPAALVAGITSLFMDGATPWIMGALVGLPIFIVVMISPILFVSGLVEIYKSSIWTLAYRDLKAMELPVQAPTPQAQAVTASRSAD